MVMTSKQASSLLKCPTASEGFESGWTADEERGEVDHVEIEPTVYDVVEDENSDGDEDEA